MARVSGVHRNLFVEPIFSDSVKWINVKSGGNVNPPFSRPFLYFCIPKFILFLFFYLFFWGGGGRRLKRTKFGPRELALSKYLGYLRLLCAQGQSEVIQCISYFREPCISTMA